jgi:uncharacterized protein YyaL (SSP411 family)
VAAIPGDALDLPEGLAAKRPQEHTVAYLCRGMTCSAPLATLGELVRALRTGPAPQ